MFPITSPLPSGATPQHIAIVAKERLRSCCFSDPAPGPTTPHVRRFPCTRFPPYQHERVEEPTTWVHGHLLSIGLVGVAISFVLGCLFGVYGYYGGAADLVILAIAGWASLARVVRGKLVELREADVVLAGRIAGHADGAIITRHLLPSFMSYLIMSITLSTPGMILGETALSLSTSGCAGQVVS